MLKSSTRKHAAVTTSDHMVGRRVARFSIEPVAQAAQGGKVAGPVRAARSFAQVIHLVVHHVREGSPPHASSRLCAGQHASAAACKRREQFVFERGKVHHFTRSAQYTG